MSPIFAWSIIAHFSPFRKEKTKEQRLCLPLFPPSLLPLPYQLFVGQSLVLRTLHGAEEARQVRSAPVIEAIRLFVNVAAKVKGHRFDIRSVYASVKQIPEVLYPVGMHPLPYMGLSYGIFPKAGIYLHNIDIICKPLYQLL